MCAWTSLCTSGGANIHPTVTGYGVIAAAFQTAVR
jgi:hypothetical protein